MPAPPDSKIKMLALHIAIGGTVKAWCAAEEISTKTAYNWTRKPAFHRLVDRHRAELVDRVLGSLTAASMAAVSALLKVVRNEEAKDADVIAASKAILGSRNELSEQADVTQRLAAIETPPPSKRGKPK